MNADEVLRALKECGDCDNCPYYSCWIDEETGDPADACNDGRLFKDILSLIESLQTQLAKAKRRAEKAVATIKSYDQMGWFCRWRDGGACTINGKREICRKGTVNGTKNPCCDWQWSGDAEEGDGEYEQRKTRL